MTEGQRDYLADLALKKGVTVDASTPRSVQWASKEIERLKALPDATHKQMTDDYKLEIQKKIENIVAEVKKWQVQ